MRQQDKKQIPFRLDEETRTKLKVKVIKEGTSIQQVLEKAVKEYLEKECK